MRIANILPQQALLRGSSVFKLPGWVSQLPDRKLGLIISFIITFPVAVLELSWLLRVPLRFLVRGSPEQRLSSICIRIYHLQLMPVLVAPLGNQIVRRVSRPVSRWTEVLAQQHRIALAASVAGCLAREWPMCLRCFSLLKPLFYLTGHAHHAVLHSKVVLLFDLASSSSLLCHVMLLLTPASIC